MSKTSFFLCLSAAAAATSSATVSFLTGTTTYDNSSVVLTPSSAVTAANAQNFFFRDTRAAMQSFVVSSPIEAAALNTIARRAVNGATFTLSLVDFGTAPAANFYTPTEVSATTVLASSNISITPALAFGQTTGGITVADDPFTTMTWTLPNSVTLVPGRTYAFILDGTSAAPGNIVLQYGLGNPFAGGLGYMQIEVGAPGPSINFRSGNDYFGVGNNQQADWALGLVAVPEPSTYGLLVGMLTVAYVMLRRRAKQN